MACHITGVYDVNRNNILPDDDYELVQQWVDSLIDLELPGILFHNNLSEKTCAVHKNPYVSFVNIVYETPLNPNIYRYFVYRDFLHAYPSRISQLFMTDISDVVAVKNPFEQLLFTANPGTLFCGDEPTVLDNEWMKAHATHLRAKIADYVEYEEKFQQETLLNCGIIGGNRPVVQEFLEKLCVIHQQYNTDNTTAYTGDMGAFNYLVRTQFNDRLLHGAPVNTVFKAYQQDRTDCWFRHK